MELFYQRLKEIRKIKNYKQKDIAEQLNITREQYQLYESGKRELPIHHLIPLCEFYNVSPEYFLGFIDEQKPIKWILGDEYGYKIKRIKRR